MTVIDRAAATNYPFTQVPPHQIFISMKKALVISGGGCKGAYAVGVLQFLKDHRPEFFSGGRFTFESYFGTSTGALIVPLASTGDLALLR